MPQLPVRRALLPSRCSRRSRPFLWTLLRNRRLLLSPAPQSHAGGAAHLLLGTINPARQQRCSTMRAALPFPAAQVVNHTFFWESMSATGGGKPTGKVRGWDAVPCSRGRGGGPAGSAAGSRRRAASGGRGSPQCLVLLRCTGWRLAVLCQHQSCAGQVGEAIEREASPRSCVWYRDIVVLSIGSPVCARHRWRTPLRRTWAAMRSLWRHSRPPVSAGQQR